MDKIEADTNGRVTFERTWSGTLVNETEGLSQVAEGLADVGHIDLAMVTYGNDVYNAMQIFFFPINDMEISMKIYDELCKKYPEIGEETSAVKVLAPSVIPPGQLQTKPAIRSLADLSGKQIAGGANHVEFFKKFNSNITIMEVGDQISGIQKGTVDGTILPFDALVALGLYEIVDNVTFLDWGYVPFQLIGMNWDTWNSLPPDIQKVFDDNYSYTNEVMHDWFGNAIETAYQVAEENGVELIQLSEADRATLFDTFDELAAKTAADLDAKGLPGTAMLDDINRLMEKYGVR
jgi:TRAP-type C4-dicarboxylate transport system substrate-binding protein